MRQHRSNDSFEIAGNITERLSNDWLVVFVETSVEELCEELAKMQITRLSLYHQDEGDGYTKKALDALAQSKDIKNLEILWPEFNPCQPVDLGVALAQMPLKHLTLAHINHLWGDAHAEMFEALAKTTTLESLHLTDDDGEAVSANNLAIILSNNKSIRSLEAHVPDFSEKCKESLKQNETITNLTLYSQSTNDDDKDNIRICDAVAENKSITDLFFHYYGRGHTNNRNEEDFTEEDQLSQEFIDSLCNMIAKNTKITSLCLDSKPECEFPLEVFKTLSTNRTIIDLSLDSAAVPCEALPYLLANNSFKSLCIDDHITGELEAEDLPHNLTLVSLSYDSFGNDSAAEVFLGHTQVKTLWVGTDNDNLPNAFHKMSGNKTVTTFGYKCYDYHAPNNLDYHLYQTATTSLAKQNHTITSIFHDAHPHWDKETIAQNWDGSFTKMLARNNAAIKMRTEATREVGAVWARNKCRMGERNGDFAIVSSHRNLINLIASYVLRTDIDSWAERVEADNESRIVPRPVAVPLPDFSAKHQRTDDNNDLARV